MKLSIVTTLYCSAPYIQEFYDRMSSSALKITDDYELIFVNDGSPDKSLEAAISIHEKDPKIIVVDLSRNFGHHKAIVAGLSAAEGDYVFLIDSDLEEPPELLNVFWKEMVSDNATDVVYGVQKSRKGNLFEKVSGSVYYWIFNKFSGIHYPKNTLTARLMKRHYVQSILNYKEKEMDLWCIFLLAGYKQKELYVQKNSKGATTYTLMRKINVAVNTITSISARPLVYIFLLGLIVTFFSFSYVGYLVVMRLVYKEIPEGYTTIVASLWLVGGILIFCIGIIGIYLSKMFLEIKNRPLTIIREIYKRNCT